MTTVSFRKTVASNIVEPIYQFARAWFPEKQCIKLRSHLERFQAIREAVVCGLETEDTHTLERALKQWLSILDTLLLVFPFGESGNAAAGLVFCWTDPFTPSKVEKFTGMYREKLAVLFNLAALYSNAALGIDRQSSTEKRKEAIHLFQKAGGIFRFISDILQKTEPVAASTLSSDDKEYQLRLVGTFEALMLAQAQTCVYEKAVADTLSRSLLSKLAHQVATWYSAALDHAEGIVSLPLTLFTWLKAQRLAFESAAQFQLANYELVEVRRRSEGYGSIIVRLRGAKALCEEAEAVAAETPDVHIDIRDLYTACSSLLTELERDNQTVYLEVLPDETLLAPPQSLSAVQLSPFISPSIVETLSDGAEVFSFLFETLRPSAVAEALESLKLRLEHLLQPVLEETLTIREQFQSLPFRDTLYIVTQRGAVEEELPDGVWEKMEEVQKNKGVPGAQTGLQAIQAGVSRCHALIHDIEEILLLGSHVCLMKETKDSASILRATLERYKKKFSDAISANRVVESLFKGTSAQHAYFSMSRQELAKCLPRPMAISAKVENIREKLAASYDEMFNVIRRLTQFLLVWALPWQLDDDLIKQLNRAVFSDEPVSKITTEFIATVVKKLNTHRTVLKQALTTLESLKTTWHSHACDINELVTSPRVQTLKALNSGLIDMLHTFQDIKEGLAFFASLSGHLMGLNEQVTTWNIAHRGCHEHDPNPFTAKTLEKELPGSLPPPVSSQQRSLSLLRRYPEAPNQTVRELKDKQAGTGERIVYPDYPFQDRSSNDKSPFLSSYKRKSISERYK